MRTRHRTAGVLLLAVATVRGAEVREADAIVYGGTSAGVMAAVQVVRMGKSVILVGPDRHLGGLSSGGLGWTDTGNKAVIGGLAREFYHRIWKHYQRDEAWRWQRREEYGNRGQGTPALDGEYRTMWVFEHHVAERVFEELITEHRIPVYRDEWLDRGGAGVELEQGTIRSIRMLSGHVYRGRMFLDATYEGDLMAAAGVSYHVGREGNDVYGEQWNGVQNGVFHHAHYFAKPVDPYVRKGDPSSGLLPRISPTPPGNNGTGDRGVQAYCFRMCLTDHPENRVPFEKPEGYDSFQYELLIRVFETGWRDVFAKFDPIPNRKTDTNNHGPFSTDNIGMNHDDPEADYERRREIVREHERYQKGLMYFLTHDPRVPAEIRERMSQWGLAKDEFTDNGHWPHQLYVREARRMIGEVVLTDQHLLGRRPIPEPVGMGSYTIDSYNVWRFVTPEGTVQNEGDIGVKVEPYGIPRGCLLPKRSECRNLVVPVCVSASHAAYGSVRMEPVFMILGQSAATIAVLAIEEGAAVQDVPYERLRERLLADGQVLEWAGRRATGGPTLSGIVVDDRAAELAGDWQESRAPGRWLGDRYLHDGGRAKGECRAVFRAHLPEPGLYAVRLADSTAPNRGPAVPVTIVHADGTNVVEGDPTRPPPRDGLVTSLGQFRFTTNRPAEVRIRNERTCGHVLVDAVQWLSAGTP